jgi:hypothetical protein
MSQLCVRTYVRTYAAIKAAKYADQPNFVPFIVETGGRLFVGCYNDRAVTNLVQWTYEYLHCYPGWCEEILCLFALVVCTSRDHGEYRLWWLWRIPWRRQWGWRSSAAAVLVAVAVVLVVRRRRWQRSVAAATVVWVGLGVHHAPPPPNPSQPNKTKLVVAPCWSASDHELPTTAHPRAARTAGAPSPYRVAGACAV